MTGLLTGWLAGLLLPKPPLRTEAPRLAPPDCLPPFAAAGGGRGVGGPGVTLWGGVEGKVFRVNACHRRRSTMRGVGRCEDWWVVWVCGVGVGRGVEGGGVFR